MAGNNLMIASLIDMTCSKNGKAFLFVILLAETFTGLTGLTEIET